MSKCKTGEEHCRRTPSVHTVVSGIFFLISCIGIIRGMMSEKRWFNQTIDYHVKDNMPALFADQLKFVFFIICISFVLHLIRIYMSILVMERHPFFYRQVIHRLKRPFYRIVEWLLRMAVIGTVLLFASLSLNAMFPVTPVATTVQMNADNMGAMEDARLRNAGTPVVVTDQLPPPLRNPSIHELFFSPLLLLYIFLVLWDVVVFFMTDRTIQIDSAEYAKAGRQFQASFFPNDISGLLMVITLLALERDPGYFLDPSLFLGTVAVLVIFALLNATLIVRSICIIIWGKSIQHHIYRDVIVGIKKKIMQVNSLCPTTERCPQDPQQGR